MRVEDLQPEQVVIGLRIRSLSKSDRLGTIVSIDKSDDDYATVKWDDSAHLSGFYGNDCECEVVEQPAPKDA